METTESLRMALAYVMRGDPFRRFGAHGIDTGPKIVEGAESDQRSLRFYVVSKRPLGEIPSGQRIPKELRFGLASDGVEHVVSTDVIEAPAAELQALPPGARHRPVPGGVRCVVPGIVGGTLGGWVWDRTDETIVILSNAHCFGGTVGAEIFQPSISGAPPGESNRIGRVKRSVALTAATPPYLPADCNFADAAIGEADSSELFDLTVLEVGPALYAVEEPMVNMLVEKFGQMTGHTRGRITSIDYNTYLEYDGIGTVVMCDLCRIVPEERGTAWSAQGDSGSLVLRQNEQTNPAIGLHFAGGGFGHSNWGAACKIGRVFDALDLDVLCSGGFAAFVDALFADDDADAAAAVAATLFARRVRAAVAVPAFYSGLAREVQARLATTPRGRALADFVQENRAELMDLLVRSGDVRRAAAHALRPILRGAVTTDALFARALSASDVERLKLLADTVDRRASDRLREGARPLRTLLESAEGNSISALV